MATTGPTTRFLEVTVTVLIVDDSRAMRMIVRRTLRQAGFDGLEVAEASNGLEALQAMQSSSPDVVLCDWNMPEMSGIELLEQLKKSGSPAKLGFVTSESTEAIRGRAMEAGALFLITKPFTVESLQECLQPVLG
jgi:two-component system, chemotaxis family, chemotaxis protein CheY